MDRGYFGIGVYHPKTAENIGTLWRSAYQFGASFIFTIGHRYKRQPSDTYKTYKHIPLWQLDNIDDLRKIYDCSQIIYIEFKENSKSLSDFNHPERCVYLLGAEDYGIPDNILKNHITIAIPTIRTQSFNVAVAGSIVMYDRFIKRS